ncbi:MAG: phage portal protein [Ginsengibacter sp.]
MVLPWNRRSHELKQITSLLTRQVSILQNRLTLETGIKNINDNIALYPEWGIIDHINSYVTNDQIFSVFSKVAETAAMIPIYAYIKKPDEKSLNNYRTKTNRQFYSSKAIFDIKLMQLKALEELPDDDLLNKLLDHPNPYQSKFEFFFSAYIFYLLKEVFIYKHRLGEGANGNNPFQLYIFPPSNVVMHVTRTFPRTVTGYDFVIDGIKILEMIPVSDIIHIKRFNPGLNFMGDDLRGLSIAEVAKKLFTRLQAEDDVAVAQLQNGGLPGIIYDKSVPTDSMGQEVLDLKRKKFYDFITAAENKGAPWMTGGEMGYFATGLKLADMEVQSLSKQDFKRLCNLLKISDSLFNNDSAATLDNLKMDIKQMYTVACLPLVYRFRDKFNDQLVNDFSDKKQRFVDCDISEITELQDDMKYMAESLSALPGGITLNQILEMFNWETRPEDFMDKPLLKSGWAFAEDSGFPAPDTNPLLAVNGNGVLKPAIA